MASGIDIAIEEVKSQLGEFKLRLSEKRKGGYDTLIAELHATTIPAKIKMAEVTQDISDLQKAMAELKKAQQELQESMLKNQEVSLESIKAQEVEQIQSQEIMQKAQKLMDQGHAALRSNNREQAMRCYIQLREVYKYLAPDNKKEIYALTLELYNGIHARG